MFLENFFEKAAQNYPTAIAIEQGERKYTYAEVERKANKFANYLKAKGIGPEDKVTILLHRCAQEPIVMLGILKAGAAYIPLDSEAPGDRVNFIMDDANAKLLVISDTIFESIGDRLDPFPLFNIDHQLDELDNFPDTKPAESGRTPNDLCYMIYTSGTTGKPKGVLLEHRNVINYVQAAQKIYPITHEDRALQGFSVSFDASTEELWIPFSVGATLVIGTFEIMRSGDQFASILNKLNITFLSCAPTLLSMVKEDIPGLRILIFGGETCTKDVAHRWCKHGHFFLEQVYRNGVVSFAGKIPVFILIIGCNSSVFRWKEDNISGSLVRGEFGQHVIRLKQKFVGSCKEKMSIRINKRFRVGTG